VVHRRYEIGGRTVGIRTTSAPFGGWLDSVLSEYRVDLGDEEDEWDLSIVVPGEDAERGRRRYNVLYGGTKALGRTLDLTELARMTLAQLEIFPMKEREDAIYLGASLLAANGSTILIPSQVTYYLHRRVRRRAERAGVPLPIEPFVAVDPGSGRLIPFRPALRIPGDALERLPGSSDRDGPPGPREGQEQTQVDVVWTVGRTLERILEPMSRGLALRNLAAATVNLDRMGSAALEGLVRLLQRAECFGVIPIGRPQIVEALADALPPNGSGA
jgi:hypothetical protein